MLIDNTENQKINYFDILDNSFELIENDNDYKLILTNHYLLLDKDLSELINNDTSIKKYNSFELLKYFWFVYSLSPKNPYIGFSTEERKRKAYNSIDEQVFNDYYDTDIFNRIESKFLIFSRDLELEYIDSALKGIETLIEYLKVVNFNQIIEGGANKGKLLHSEVNLQKVLEKSGTNIKLIKELKNNLQELLEEKNKPKVRGNSNLGIITH